MLARASVLCQRKYEYFWTLFVPGCFLVVLVGQARQCLLRHCQDQKLLQTYSDYFWHRTLVSALAYWRGTPRASLLVELTEIVEPFKGGDHDRVVDLDVLMHQDVAESNGASN